MTETGINLSPGILHRLAGPVVAIAASLGAGLTAWIALTAAGDALSAVSRWRRGPCARLKQLQPSLQEPEQQVVSTSRPVWLALIGAGALFGVIARDPVLSPWLLILGSGLAWWWRRFSSRRRRRSRAARQVLCLLQLLDNGIGDSVSGALVQAAQRMEAGPVKTAVENATQAHFGGTPWPAALREHLNIDRALNRLSLLLAVAPGVERQALRDAIQAQISMISCQKNARAEARARLALPRTALLFLAIANAMAVLAVLLLPAWRRFFTSTLARRVVFALASLVASAGYVILSEEIATLKKGVQ